MPVVFSKDEQYILDLEDELAITFPSDFMGFYREIGFGFLCVGDRGKRGHHRVFSPGELLELYFEPENECSEDLFATFRMSAWEKLEGSGLLALCTFGDEDSLIYLGISDGAVYYLSSRMADSLWDFLTRLDEKADYFLK